METMDPKACREQNTIEILITASPSTACSKSFKELVDEHQQNSKASWIRSIDAFILRLVYLIRTIWNILPKAIRGCSNEGQVFTSYVRNMKLDIPPNLTFSPEDLETTLIKNQFAVMLAYTCNEYIKRDIKKLFKNTKLVQFSQKYPLCALNNYSDYFNRYIKMNIPKSYSVYLVVFGTNLLSEVIQLDVYKPIDEEILDKIEKTIDRFKLDQTKMLQGPGDVSAETVPQVRERHFSIPKVLELEDLAFPNEGENNNEVLEQIQE